MMERDDAKQMLTDVLAGTRIDPRPPRQFPARTRTCVVIGGSTLAVRCIQLLLIAGYVVEAVLPSEPTLAKWAAQEELPTVDTITSLEVFLENREIDWLFSIVNPLVLPPSLLTRFRQGAFNYHDAPLPRYAGTHATTWALLAEEVRHAITWHRIDAAVDAGDIALQCDVAIEPGESALSLNLKCYQAAAAGFSQLLSDLMEGTLIFRPQDSSLRTFFPRRCRPEAAGCLRWDRTAQALSAMVRALTFGPYHPNPVSLPKVLVNEHLLWVSRLEVLPERSGSKPGTLVDIAPEYWRVATSSEDVVVGFSESSGAPLDSFDLAAEFDLMEGDTFSLISDLEARNLKNAHEAVALDEAFWVERLERFSELQLPFQKRLSQSSPGNVAGAWQRSPTLALLTADERIAFVWGAWLLYLARLTDDKHLQLGWTAVAHEETDTSEGPTFFASVVPTNIDLDLDWRPAHLLDAIALEQARLAKRKTYARDLLARFPSLRAMPSLHTFCPWQIGISILTGTDNASHGSAWREIASGSLLTLQFNPTDGVFRFAYDSVRVPMAELESMTSHLLALTASLASPENSDRAIGRIRQDRG